MSNKGLEKVDTVQQEMSNDVAFGSVSERNVDWLPEEEAAVRRKLDFTITPLVTVMYMLCAMDR